MRGLRRCLWFFLVTLSAVCANTEIVNFDAVESVARVPLPISDWTRLHPSNPERILHVQPAPLYTEPAHICAYDVRGDENADPGCPHEIWLVLDVDGSDHKWSRYARFTLRISWPAWAPTNFFINIYSSDSVHDVMSLHAKTSTQIIANPEPMPTDIPTGESRSVSRTMFAHIRLVDTGVRPPAAAAPAEPVPFVVLLEPLYFGVVPASVVPIIAFLVPVVLCAAWVVAPFVNAQLARVADQARKEIVLMKAAKRKHH
ncbi:predicted protein [Postia placenta Mad-698-R]|uniref:Uncharacterized protein n=1 Tax=Postia placenta MAD-698-R-SB12 TaxID=670580 RepID=A0A1X6NDY9_9APHY|nr:hypothetical protein POSPLADRAFT_1050954 [Postia placenta MAD-698-R-SB12]EED80347.1 predicted protein [Postia placenta Mad-698-R]OSX66784.1 hypothetical protein POSPLADRAFT_1050954 [Postia placenta MAD-698-R-SB12]